MKVGFPIYKGWRGANCSENPRSITPPPPPCRKTLFVLKPTANIPRKNPRSGPRNPKSISRRQYNPYRVRPRPTGAKLAEEEELSPEKPRSVPPPPPLVAPPSPPALPVSAGESPDRGDPKIYRRLPRSWFKYRVLPNWMHVGVAAAGRSETAPAEDSAGPENPAGIEKQ